MSTSPAVLALLCLIASGVLDLVFKLYASRPRSRGMLVFGIGCVWILLQWMSIKFSGESLVLDAVTLKFGFIAAIFVTASNILLIECLGHLPLSIASTIYRLNTIPLVILAFLFLGEDISIVKLAGIGAGLVTVFLLYQPNGNSVHLSERYLLFIFLIIFASCLRALYGVFTKAGVDQGSDANTMMMFAAIGWCIGGLAYAALREKRVVINRAKLRFIPVAGLLVFSIVWLLTTALTLGDASVVVPLANMGFVAAFVFSIVFRFESFTGRNALAIGSAVVSIVLLTSVA